MSAGGKGDACETWRLLFDLLLSHRAHLPSVAAEFDLSEMQGHVLRLVEPAGGVSMGRLARSLACDASNVTGIVDRLEARGLLVRQPDEVDRRLKVIALTPRGAAIRAKLLERLAEPPDAIAGLSGEDQRLLCDILHRALAPAARCAASSGSRSSVDAPVGSRRGRSRSRGSRE